MLEQRITTRPEFVVPKSRFETLVRTRTEAYHFAAAKGAGYVPVDLSANYRFINSQGNVLDHTSAMILKQPGSASLFYQGIELWDIVQTMDTRGLFYGNLREALRDAQKYAFQFDSPVSSLIDTRGLFSAWKRELQARGTQLAIVSARDFDEGADHQRTLTMGGRQIPDFSAGLYVLQQPSGVLDSIGEPFVVEDEAHQLPYPKQFGFYRGQPISRASILIKDTLLDQPDKFIGCMAHEFGHDQEARALSFLGRRSLPIAGQVRAVVPTSEVIAEAHKVVAHQLQFDYGDTRETILNAASQSVYHVDRYSGKVYKPRYLLDIALRHHYR